MKATAFCLLAVTALLGAVLSGPAPVRKTVRVTIDNFSFTPAILTVPAGTQVTWINHDDVPHTVVSTGGRFRSGALDTDGRFSYTFTTRGTYAYFCSVHPMMTAKVIVR